MKVEKKKEKEQKIKDLKFQDAVESPLLDDSPIESNKEEWEDPCESCQ